MYDTIKWRLDISCLSISERDKVTSNLSIYSKTQYEGGYSLNGSLKDLRIKITKDWLKGEGSLAKYFLGDNIQTLTRKAAQQSIERLSEELGIDISKANVLRLDLAQNFKTKAPEMEYIKRLGELPRFERLPQSNGVYYKTKNQVLVFYSKVKELKDKGVYIPERWKHSYILRYELRLMQRIPNQLNRKTVLMEDLYQEEFYLQMLILWRTKYNEIKKVKELLELKPTTSTKELEEMFACLALQAIGQERALDMVNSWKREGLDKKQLYNHRNLIRKLSSLDAITRDSELISELDEKIEVSFRYCR